LRSIFDIRIRAHYTCVVAFVLITAIVSAQFPESYPLWQTIILGISTALLFFISVSTNELIISLTVISRQNPINNITIFAFGGVFETIQEATSPNRELLMALARFLSNLTITTIFYGIYATLINSGNFAIAGIAQWLVFIWFMVFLINFVPGYPLDGGRVLRALLWKSSGDYFRATHIATLIGWCIGLLLIFSGVLASIITHQWFLGLAVTFIGWSIQSAAGQIRRQTVLLMALQLTNVRDIMTREYKIVNRGVTVGQLFRDHILASGWCYFIVVDGAKLQGILTKRNIKSVPRRRWNSTPIGEIMTPSNEINFANPLQSGASVLQKMEQMGIDDMPVLEDGNVIGIIVRETLVRLGKVRAEFGV
jgi:Zn-dependent protease/predicted transcriptional regulator